MDISTLTPKVIRAGEGKCLDLGGEVRHQLLDGKDTGGALALARSSFKFQSGSPLHVHTREDEWFFVERGQFEFYIGGTKTTLNQGDFVFAPMLIPHSYTCCSEDGGGLMIGTFGAGFEDFFRILAEMKSDGLPLHLATMKTLAAEFGVILGDFNDIDVALSLPQIVRSTEGECLEAFGDWMRVLLPSNATQNRYFLSESQTPPLGGPPLHVHKDQHEIFIIKAGRFEFQLGDARVQVSPGDVIFAPAGLPHTFRVVSSEPGRFLVLVTPGDFEAFFREAKGMFERGEITPQTMTTLGDRYGIRFLPVNA